MRKQGLPRVESVLELFEWADLKIVPSCYGLEPIEDAQVIFTGPFGAAPNVARQPKESRNAIVVYMGNGSIRYPTQLSVLPRAFQDTPYQVYIASYQAQPADFGNIHVARRFDFQALLPRAVAMIHHGGQNSLISAILHETPQIVFPGNVFERQYNAASVERLKLGICCPDAQFNPAGLAQLVTQIQSEPGWDETIRKVKRELMQLGGVEKVSQCLAALCREKVYG